MGYTCGADPHRSAVSRRLEIALPFLLHRSLQPLRLFPHVYPIQPPTALTEDATQIAAGHASVEVSGASRQRGVNPNSA